MPPKTKPRASHTKATQAKDYITKLQRARISQQQNLENQEDEQKDVKEDETKLDHKEDETELDFVVDNLVNTILEDSKQEIVDESWVPPLEVDEALKEMDKYYIDDVPMDQLLDEVIVKVENMDQSSKKDKEEVNQKLDKLIKIENNTKQKDNRLFEAAIIAALGKPKTAPPVLVLEPETKKEKQKRGPRGPYAKTRERLAREQEAREKIDNPPSNPRGVDTGEPPAPASYYERPDNVIYNYPPSDLTQPYVLYDPILKPKKPKTKKKTTKKLKKPKKKATKKLKKKTIKKSKKKISRKK